MSMSRGTASLLAVPLLLLALSIAFAVSAGAADRDVMGDWVVSGGVTRVSNETIDVRGSVNVTDGGTLLLEDCVLTINGTSDGEAGLVVTSTGHLEARRCTIRGSPSRYRVVVDNDTLIDGCTLHHLHSTATERAVRLTGGDITIRNTTVRDAGWNCLAVSTDLAMVNVTVTDVRYCQLYIVNTLLADDAVIRIDGCVFDGHSTEVGRASLGMQLAIYTGYDDVDMLVTDTRVEFFSTGVNINCNEGLTFTAEDCDVVDCWKGFDIRQTGSTVTLRGNRFDRSCVIVAGGDDIDVRLEDDVIEHADRGLVLQTVWATSYACVVENLTLRNCTEGVVGAVSAGGNRLDIAVRNSTLESVATGFVAGESTRISVHDTVHVPGSGRTSGTSSWIRAYTKLRLEGVRWMGGPTIGSGGLHLKDAGGATFTVFDLAAPLPREVLGWQRSEASNFTHTRLTPAMLADGHWFEGGPCDIWSAGPLDVTLVDDVAPTVSIARPANSTGVNSSLVEAEGACEDLGSGLARLERSLDDGAFQALDDLGDGRWNLTLPGLADGWHNLSVRGVDATGNVGNASRAGFLVDTKRPFLYMSTPPALVNDTRLALAGRTEPWSLLTLNDREVPVAPNGTFSTEVQLAEGPNSLVFRVTDRAGNALTTSFVVVRDTCPPLLAVTSPANATWVNVTSVVVRGTVEPGSDLEVMGGAADVTGGAFACRVDLVEGEAEVVVSARDPAGNQATVTLVLHVDLTPPDLAVTSPAEDVVHTREQTLWIRGEVDDLSILTVQLNDWTLGLFAGGFSKLCMLPEGRTEYVVSVVDRAGNGDTQRLVVFRDLEAPAYEALLISRGGQMREVGGHLYSTGAAVEVLVTVGEPASIVLGNGTVRPPAEEHRWTVDLAEGRNAILFEVEDLAGNRGEAFAREVRRDTTPPFIRILEPAPGNSTRERRVIVHGSTEAGSSVRVAGEAVDVDTEGGFRTAVDLELGPNEVRVEVTDEAGNANWTALSIERVRVPEGAGGGAGTWAVAAAAAALATVLAVAYAASRRRGREVADDGGAEAPDRDAPAAPGGTDVGPGEGAADPSEWEEY